MKTRAMESEVLTVRIDKASLKGLESLAGATERSKSYLAAEAIRQYLELQAWQVEGIRKGLKQADEGRFADSAKVEATFRKYRA